MTFREKLAHVAKDDPDFARSARNWRIASWVFGIAVVVALAFGAWSLKIGFSNSTQITKIESPCLKYGPDSHQCEEAFSAAVLTITHPQACAIERKAGSLKAIRELAAELGVDFTEPCAGARIEQERVRGKERAATRQQGSGEGDTPQSGTGGGVVVSTGGDQDGSVRGGVGKSPGGPKGKAPASSPAASSPTSIATAPANESPGNSEGNGSSESSKAKPIAEGVGKALEDVGASAGGVVTETGESVNKAAEGVTGKACGVLGASC